MTNLSEHERVRANTLPAVNRRIDRQIEEDLRHYSTQPKEVIARRIWQLEEEWDFERVLESMAASLSLAGLTLALVRGRRWNVFPAVILSFLLLHAIQGWCPPLPVLRRLGVRTREEIERERHALAALIKDGANGAANFASDSGN